jgi:hypothetical protein
MRPSCNFRYLQRIFTDRRCGLSEFIRPLVVFGHASEVVVVTVYDENARRWRLHKFDECRRVVTGTEKGQSATGSEGIG